MVFQKMWFLVRGNLVWNIYAFVPSKAGLTKEVVFQKRWSLVRGNLVLGI